ncbi:MAG: hypothetical protein ACK4L4_19735, partial [Gemmobacter sp.]
MSGAADSAAGGPAGSSPVPGAAGGAGGGGGGGGGDGPDFPSGSRDDRITLRHRRVQERMAAMREDGAGSKADASRQELSRGKQQIADSLSLLDNKKATSIELTTAVRVEADARENQRRVEEEGKRQDRLRRLQEEAMESSRRNAAVEMRWAELMEHNMPQELWREITAQREACERIIASKDAL